MLKFFRYFFIVFLLMLTGVVAFNTNKQHFLTDLSNKLRFEKLINEDVSLRDLIKKNGGAVSILISKSKYRLYIMQDGTALKSYEVVFGSNPIDDKLRQGDNCTPEGSFFIQTKYPHKKWSRFMLISYPNAQSREKFNTAKQKGLIPASAAIGGSVGIHGVPSGFDYCIKMKMNWTKGCISLTNKDIVEIYQNIPVQTEVTIVH